ncbi:hypothetical protein DD238_002838 [Peronospora effusa]|uniref:Uncharacterized protein n=1 Tax=Peronospora effusa TaxID=542832 RepID=A0A3M6VN76_9STRA|nr:hypothetical protein DD238_002838 [Peronospora effusa]
MKRGHNDLHNCDVLVHMCDESCSAKNCSIRCVLNVEDPHIAHKCVEVRCMQKCVMDGCNETCGIINHIHGQVDVAVVFSVENGSEKGSSTFNAASDAPVVHTCENGHEYQAMCEEKGICRVDVFLKQGSRTFLRARGRPFSYYHRTRKCIKAYILASVTRATMMMMTKRFTFATSAVRVAAAFAKRNLGTLTRTRHLMATSQHILPVRCGGI